MNIIIVDDDKNILQDMCQVVEKACPKSHIQSFQDSDQAVEYLKQNETDIAFLDIEMSGKSGIELAHLIKETHPKTNIIFVTGYSQYAIDAFSMHASGYILKPATVDRVYNEVANLRNRTTYNIPHLSNHKNCITVHTFGNFEIFYKNAPLKFYRQKTKELLAYLIDRKGAGCTSAELCAVLWEDRIYNLSLQKQYQTLVSDLLKTLGNVDSKDIIIKRRNFISVDTTKIDCDYYRFLKGDAIAVNSYTGEYMTNYSWAEFTTGYLSKY